MPRGVRRPPDFRGLHAAMRTARPDPSFLTLHAFDLMHLDGRALRALSLEERLARFDKLTDRAGGKVSCLYRVDRFDDGAGLLVWCGKFGLEGSLEAP